MAVEKLTGLTGFLVKLDRRMDLEYMLYAFWMLFWLFNGLDKFYNGNWVWNDASYATKGVLIDTVTGNVTHNLQPMQPEGWFGVNRDSKTIGYFARLGLPAEMAIGSLYGIAVVEVILGLTFGLILLNKVVFNGALNRYAVFSSETANRLAFKTGVLIFTAFAFADTMFGDRTELWEHGTFLILTLLTYQLYIQRSEIESDEESTIETSLATSES